MTRVKKSTWKRVVRTVAIWAVVVVIIHMALLVYCYFLPVYASHGRIFSNVDKLGDKNVGLIFGTSDRLSNGQDNPYFRYRIDAAEALWKAGKLQTVLVSGDNRTAYYNEPEKMKQALIERGIPKSRIFCDYAGLSTLDSVVRAKEVFGLTSIVFISQRFQDERAIYLAKANGIDAYGFAAQEVNISGDRTKFREVAARVKMWLDVNVFHSRPTHLGEKISLPK